MRRNLPIRKIMRQNAVMHWKNSSNCGEVLSIYDRRIGFIQYAG